MTLTNLADPVDFEAFGDYAPPAPKASPSGAWSHSATDPAAFQRPKYRFQGRITADGSSGYLAEPGRYHLYVSWACPWAHRSAIVRALVGIEEAVSLSAVDPIRDGRGWAFREGPGCGPDPVNGFRFLTEAYLATDPEYDGHVSVPVLWDRSTSRIVSNNFPDISLDLGSEFAAWARSPLELYPPARRAEIDALNDTIYETVNDGVYRTGFAASQQQYEANVGRVFETLDEIEHRLASRRYLLGDEITESDVRLWVTLARFDAVYYSHFKVNLRRVVDYPALWDYARDLYQNPAFSSTTKFDQIKRHYYVTHGHLNPSRIVPAGPLVDWNEPAGRSLTA
ncbi:MAG: glutathione S-transferase C-terminal domain-containing protein [Acidimicrobiales bacterium]|jgi:putative glutathione S-transferase